MTIERGHRARRFNFTLGSGSAKLELESFSGSVELARYLDAGQAPAELLQPGAARRRSRHGPGPDQDDDAAPAKTKTKHKDKGIGVTR